MERAKSVSAALSRVPGQDIAWKRAAAIAVAIAVSLGLATLLDSIAGDKVTGLAFPLGIFFGVMAITGPFFMALKVVLTTGVGLVLACGLATLGIHNAWIAVIGMVLIIFLAALWNAIPLVGGLIGSFPTVIFLLIIATGSSMTSDASVLRVMAAAASSVVAGVIVCVIFSGWDHRKALRGVAAMAWNPTATTAQQGQAFTLLRLGSAPRALVAVAQAATLSRIAKGWLGAQEKTPAYAAGVKAQSAMAAAILPKGPIVPRDVGPAVPDAREKMRSARRTAGHTPDAFAWNRWEAGLEYGSGVLEGRVSPSKAVLGSGSIIVGLVRSVIHPDSALFRYAVQRAVALGVVTVIMVNSTLVNFDWVFLAVFAVLQVNASATMGRAIQYAVGTWVGGVGAVILGAVVPGKVVGLAAIALVILSFAWMVRNYFVMCMGIAAGVVLITGAPKGEYVHWAVLRAIDVSAGAVFAILVSFLLLRVRPLPQAHLKAAQTALISCLKQVRARLANPAMPATKALAGEGAFYLATSNLQSDIELLDDPDPVAAQLAQLEEQNDQVLAIASVVFESGIETPDLHTPDARGLFDNGLAKLEREILSVGRGAVVS